MTRPSLLRGHRDIHGVAGFVFRLVERDFEGVRRIGARFGIEAGIERDGRERAGRFAGRDFEPVAAPAHRQGETRGIAARDVKLAVGDAARGFDRLVIPVAVLPIPLIAALDLQKLVAQAGPGNLLAVAIDQNHVEGCVIVFAERLACEQRLDADHVAFGRYRERDLAFDRAAAGFGKPDGHARFEQALGGRQLVEFDLECRLAVVVGIGKVAQRLLLGIHRFTGETEAVAGEAGPLLRRRQQHLAFDVETRGGCTIKEAAVERDFRRCVGRDLARRRCKLEFQTIRHIIFHHESGFADGGTLRIGKGLHAPGAAAGGLRDRHRQRTAAEALILQHVTAIFDAVRPLDHERQRHAIRGDCGSVAQQRRDVHGLAGAIDAAFGKDESVEPVGRLASGDAAIGEIEGRRLQIEERIIGFVGSDQQRRRQSALAARRDWPRTAPSRSHRCA